MKIVFFGTSDFAVPSLERLYDSFQIAAVVTAPDKRGGRGRKELLSSPVKQFAEVKGIKILQPTNLRATDFTDLLRGINADLFVVIAFRMLPKVVWNMPPRGTINLHASLLPSYRGAAPINHAIIQGEKETGLTVFKIDDNIDTGDLLCRKKISIEEGETAGELHDRMAAIGGPFLVECIQKYQSGEILPVQQDSTKVSQAPKLTKEFCQLNFNQSGKEVLNKIRGLSPYPGAYAYLEGLEFKIIGGDLAEKRIINEIPNPGKIISDGKSWMAIGTLDRWVYCTEVQLQGKRRMIIKDFLNGWGKKLPDSTD
jgi:methionyl-tRNA formyltransferase